MHYKLAFVINDMNKIIKKKLNVRIIAMYKIVDLQTFLDPSGEITIANIYKTLNFTAKRCYWILNTNKDDSRGNHAHKNLKQLIVVSSGSVDILLDDGKNEAKVSLTSPHKGLFLEGLIWRKMFNFSTNCVITILCDEDYNEDDYIRNYDDFLIYVKNIENDHR